MSAPLEIADATALAEAFATARQDGQSVRLVGSGQWAPWLPTAPAEIQRLSTAPMNRITRLDPADATCSVEPGVTLGALAEALAPHGLRLPCATGRSPDGTVAGLFAADPIGPLTPGGPEPRNLLLGMSGMLSDGTRFKTGAKVVKSVAGFDLHKLFVGSEGTLFAATELHLKLRPQPRAVVGFATEMAEWTQPFELMLTLRRSPLAPAGCVLELDQQSARLRGWFEGSTASLRTAMQTFGLQEAPVPAIDSCLPPPTPDSLRTAVPIHAFRGFWDAEQGFGAAIRGHLTGGGRLCVTGQPHHLEQIGRMLATSAFPRSSRPATRPTSQRQALLDLEQRLRDALDSGGVLR